MWWKRGIHVRLTDPFSSLFKYMPEAPKDVFYDFACQLSEYCLNREPQYFLCTRFWHDLFHGITHKCGKCFKSSRVCGMVGVNSEICEQFNWYLQNIKYTGSHLTQSHFMFFVQFFIYLWNKEKNCKVWKHNWDCFGRYRMKGYYYYNHLSKKI